MKNEIVQYVPMCQVLLKDGRAFLVRVKDRDRVEHLWAEKKPVRLEGKTIDSYYIKEIGEVKETDLTIRLTTEQRQQLSAKKRFYFETFGKHATEDHITFWCHMLLDGENLTI